MSITHELRASACATYRALFRAAAYTFKGDDHVLNAFRQKVRTEFHEGRSQSDPTAYAARVQFGREVADVLRRNVVQGVKVEQANSTPSQDRSMVLDGHGVWRLRITEHTELGSNESIKSRPSPSRMRKLGKGQPCCSSTASVASYSTSSSVGLRIREADIIPNPEIETENQEGHHEDSISDPSFASTSPSAPSLDPSSLPQNPSRNLNFSALKRAHKCRVKPDLDEADIEESFVRGSGPGGQSINKTKNNVQLMHKPTGIRITCQETRSLQQNRLTARKKLLEKLDQIANPGLSKENLKHAKQIERERRRRKKAKKKTQAKMCSSM
ncbi:hypothetical protein EW145_g2065 [Phellinidium pouzarii]|uniref:Uncharacterized protein n=1 Tax=Phellinidium pouzarii TaxID=167371 RepID=A0A4S4LE43_9AGAM|nr:hypothetical protein EW145_g2065 [Phellinidium pouzarii]